MDAAPACRICFGTCKRAFSLAPSIVLRCDNCGLVFFEAVPSTEILESYYSEYSYREFLPPSYSVEHSTAKTLTAIRKLIPKRNPVLLDYGCGQGDLVLIARDLGFDSYGFEVSKGALDLCSKRGVPTLSVNEIKSKKFDLITAYEVVEHLAHPAEVLLLLNNILHDSGILYLTTPNSNSLSNRWGRNSSLLYPEHLSLFSKKSVSVLASLYGFGVVDIRTEGLKSHFLLSLRDLVSDNRKDTWSHRNFVDTTGEFPFSPETFHLTRNGKEDILKVSKIYKGFAFTILQSLKGMVNFILTWLGIGETLKVTLRKVKVL